MNRSKYRKLLAKEIIDTSKYPQVTSPIVKYRGDRDCKDITFEWSCITEPFEMDDEPSVNDCDQYLFFGGTDLDDRSEFQAEVEVYLGEEKQKHVITEPKIIYIPKGFVHGPINFKKINKPIILMNFLLSPQVSMGTMPKNYEDLIAKPSINKCNATNVLTLDGHPFSEQHIEGQSMLEYDASTNNHGKLRFTEHTLQHWYLQGEPFHMHPFDKYAVVIGGNPLDVEDFDAELLMYMGKEEEKVTMDCTSVFRIAGGLRHGHLLYSEIKKPIWFFFLTLIPGKEYTKEDVSYRPGDYIASKGSPLEAEEGSRAE